MRRWTLCFALASSACTGGPTVEVAEAEIAQRIVALAEVVPRDGVARVRVRHFSQVVSVSAAEGDAVHVGDTLCEVDDENRLVPEALTAPIDGVVLARRAGVGDDVSPAEEPLFEIADASHVEARFELEGEDATRDVLGARFAVTARGGGEPLASGVVARLSARMEERELGGADARARARGRVRAGWGPLEAGTTFPIGRQLEVVIELPAAHVGAAVPRSAIVVRDGATVVLVPGALGDREVRVRVGRVDAEHAEVTGIDVGTAVRRDAR